MTFRLLPGNSDPMAGYSVLGPDRTLTRLAPITWQTLGVGVATITSPLGRTASGTPPLPPTATPQPTPFPTLTPTYIAPSASFTSTVAEGVTYPPGTCFTFYWSVTGVEAVYFDGQGVPGQGQQQVCPAASRSYTLHIVYANTTTQDLSIPVLIGP